MLFVSSAAGVQHKYQVEALVIATGKIYRQTYAGVLVSENGKVKLFHEALDTLAVSQAFSKVLKLPLAQVSNRAH